MGAYFFFFVYRGCEKATFEKNIQYGLVLNAAKRNLKCSFFTVGVALVIYSNILSVSTGCKDRECV